MALLIIILIVFVVIIIIIKELIKDSENHNQRKNVDFIKWIKTKEPEETYPEWLKNNND